MNREYYRESREIWERVTYYSEIGLKDMASGRVVWPIADDNLFRMQIEAMEDINSIEIIRIIKKEEERLIFPYGMQIEVTPVLFALLTGNRKRLCWLLSQGAKLDGGWPMWRERDLKPLLNPFGEEHNWCTNALEIAILSGNPGMVEFVLERAVKRRFTGPGTRWRGRENAGSPNYGNVDARRKSVVIGLIGWSGPSILQGVQCGIICGDIFRSR